MREKLTADPRRRHASVQASRRPLQLIRFGHTLSVTGKGPAGGTASEGVVEMRLDSGDIPHPPVRGSTFFQLPSVSSWYYARPRDL